MPIDYLQVNATAIYIKYGENSASDECYDNYLEITMTTILSQYNI